MSFNLVAGTPGIKTTRTATPRKVLLGNNPLITWPGGKIIDGSKSRDTGHTGYLDILRPGTLMGRITATGKYAPCFMGQVATDYTSGGTSLSVGAACATEILRRVGSSGVLTVVGAPTAGGTVAIHTVAFSAVNTSTGVLTITNIGANVDDGALVCAADGSHLPKAIIGDGYGIKVTDEDGNSVDVGWGGEFSQHGCPMVLGGIVDVTMVPYWPAAEDTTLIAWIKAALCDHMVFSDDY